MSSKILNPEKLISGTLRSLAKKNKAKSYSAWLNDKSVDERIKASRDLIKANTLYALEKRDAKENTGILNSGYSKYLSEKSKSNYLNAVSKAEDELEQKRERSIDGYRKYVEALDEKRKELVNSTFKSILTLGITDVNEAYQKAKTFGLSNEDAKAVARDTTSATRTELFRKAVSNIITRYYTSTQAKEYARSIGLPQSDVDELGKVADILNQLTSNQKYYSGDYAQYIESLKNTTK